MSLSNLVILWQWEKRLQWNKNLYTISSKVFDAIWIGHKKAKKKLIQQVTHFCNMTAL